MSSTARHESNLDTLSSTSSRRSNNSFVSGSRRKRGRDTSSSRNSTRDASGVWAPTGLLLRALCVFAAVACSQSLIEADQEYLDSFYTELGGDDWVNNANWTASDAVGWGVEVRTDENGTDHVVQIVLESNNLVGTIPDVESGQLEHLEILKLGDNSISGPLPAGLGNLVAIQELELNNNLLTGDIPPEVGSLPNLSWLDIQNNALTGEIPPELGSLPSLTYLDLRDNSLSEEIPSELGNVATLVRLYLQNNNLEGLVPGALGKLSSLNQLDLSGNVNLIGPIPPQFGDLVSLKGLDLNGNSLTEPIPPELGVLGQGGELNFLDLSDNFLTGDVPDGLGDVEDLYLDGNFIDGYEIRDDELTAPPYPTPPPTPSPTPAPTTAPVAAPTLDPTPTPTRIPTTGPTAPSPSPSLPATASDPSTDVNDVDDGDDDGGDGSRGINAGAIAGAVVAAALGAALIVAGWRCWTRRKLRKREASPGGKPAGGKVMNGGGCCYCDGRGWFARFAPFRAATPQVRGRDAGVDSSPSVANVDRGNKIPAGSAASSSGERRPSHGCVESRRGGASAPACDGRGNSRSGQTSPSGDTQWSVSGSSIRGYDNVGAVGAAVVIGGARSGSPASVAGVEAAPPHGSAAGRAGSVWSSSWSSSSSTQPRPLPPREPAAAPATGVSGIAVASAADPTDNSRSANFSVARGGCDGVDPLAVPSSPEGLPPQPPMVDAATAAETLSLAGETLCRTNDSNNVPGPNSPPVQLGSPVFQRHGSSSSGSNGGGVEPCGTDSVAPRRGGAPPGVSHPGNAKRGFWETLAGWGPSPPSLRHTKSTAVDTTGGGRTGTGESLVAVGASGSARSMSLNVPPPDKESDLLTTAQNDRHPGSVLGLPCGPAGTGAAGYPSPFFQPGSASGGHCYNSAGGGSHGSGRSGGGSGGSFSSAGRPSWVSGSSGTGRLDSVLEVAKRVSGAAQNSSIIGVPEVATLVETLVNLSADHRGNREAFEKIGDLCYNLTKVLESVKELLSKDPQLDTGGVLLEHVEEKVRTVVEVMKAYQGASRMKRMWQASFYKRRVDEAEAAVRHTLDYLHMALQAYSLRRMDAVSESLARITDSPSVRRKHHRQNLIQSEEIPEGSIEISDLMIGAGGASNVFMAHYAGENVAAKVVTMKGDDPREIEQQRKSFLAEVRNMRRLNNSPRVVRVFGIVTWRPGELVLVMKYMAGGDLFSFIKKHREKGEEIDEKLARNLISHAAEGMKYLHQQKTWHGDLKSLNILLDAHNNAHISDFGTSHWTEETKSKVLQSKTPGAGAMNQLSIHWAAPEVLENPFCVPSFMSDVYSFGIVVWEVLSREVPWAGLSGRELRIKVCIECAGPPMPASAPPDLVELARACWQYEPEHRPTFDDIVKYLNGEDAPLTRHGEGTTGRGEAPGAGRSDSGETVVTERVS